MELIPLRHLAVVEFSGADAARFLHGQLSNDVLALADGESQLTSLNSPKGRVVAILRLLRRADRLYAILPESLAVPLVERLGKYVLRTKVTLRVATPELAVYGSLDAPERFVLQAPPAKSTELDTAGSLEAWKRSAIAAGLPQVYSATSEVFVAQMLNLDLVNGISFRKGCYTGQEIIARTQNLGRIKRRMLRFAISDRAALAVGESVRLGKFGSATVVETASAMNGGRELLAVVHLEPLVDDPKDTAPLQAKELPLPYTIPEKISLQEITEQPG
jgi:tRNA-modifying protein YgfZ